MTIDWDWLKVNMPRIAGQLSDMMVNDALNVVTDEDAMDLVMSPEVAITFRAHDPDKQGFTVRLSVEFTDPES